MIDRAKLDLWYSSHLALRQDLPTELKEALKNYPRKKVLFDRFQEEMSKALKVTERRGKIISQRTVQAAFSDFTDMFIASAKTYCDQRAMSDIEKSRIKQEAQDIEDMKATADGKPQGIFEELGVQVGETTLEGGKNA